MTRAGLVIFLIWLLASLVAIAFAVLQIDSVAVDGSYVPSSNDAFYHARRILDAAVGERGFYQFDHMIHVPEGSWLTWPWAYDLAVAWALKAALWLSPALNPMQFLVYVPAAWIPVHVVLLLAICATLKLRTEFRAFVALGFALLPLTQSLHRIGELDHHFIELTFVLLSFWLALRWLASRDNVRAAIACGIGLGLAHGFHNGLFILQLPLLVTVGLLWLRGHSPGKQSLLALAGALLSTTLITALPSGPLLEGQFSLTTLSWFQVYVAACSATLITVMALRPYSGKALGMLLLLGALLAVPVISEMVLGAAFLTGRIVLLDQILEMTSPLRMITGSWGLAQTLGQYSGLLLLVPVLGVVFLYQAVTETRPTYLCVAVFSVFGLSLLLLQYRLHYFGLPFLLIGPFYLLEKFEWGAGKHRLAVAMTSLLVFALMFQPPLRGTLFTRYPLANDLLYEQTRTLFGRLQPYCQSDPGIVAAASQFGHYIRFHTDCPVIANNFLLTDLHERKVETVNEIFGLSPESLRQKYPDVRYILAYLANVYELVDGTVRLQPLQDIARSNPPLITGLFFAKSPAPGFEVIGEVTLDAASQQFVLARLYKVSPLQQPSTPIN